MDELLARMMHGVDPDDPAAFLHIFANLMAMVPWFWLTVSSLAFVAVGAWIGHRRGQLWQGAAWGAVLGPIGWWFAWRMKPLPPPLPRPAYDRRKE